MLTFKIQLQVQLLLALIRLFFLIIVCIATEYHQSRVLPLPCSVAHPSNISFIPLRERNIELSESSKTEWREGSID